MLMIWLLYGMIMVGLVRGILPGWMRFMDNHKLTECNFAGERIPTAGGLLIWLMLLVHTMIMKVVAYFNGDTLISNLDINPFLLNEFVLASSLVVFLGFLDDTVGNKTFKGFAGHWKLWKEHGVVSTGLLKAGGISLASMLFILHGGSEIREPILWVGGQYLLIVLATNGINLLDTRPGRAIKGFGVLFILLAAALLIDHPSRWQEFLVLSLPVLVSVLVLAIPDLKGNMMLGDTGANLLGFVLGCWAVYITDWKLQLLLLAFFIALHGITWRVSLSKLIDSNRVLSYLDWLGRDSGPNKI
ncbi:hypothetical protein [Paenibacillus sp. RC67]|uniref:hypothetical protein n=1 Tax=Paenibacillus sp. RC67 TaxID=3039392 RepID=UPI0024ACDBFA|nr:hypothetical protein [Paenibacillus sp. RC67]